jgi:hypothetical protein
MRGSAEGYRDAPERIFTARARVGVPTLCNSLGGKRGQGALAGYLEVASYEPSSGRGFCRSNIRFISELAN